VTPAVAGGVVVHLTREGIVENDRPAVEQGHYLDRPGRVAVDAGRARVGGRTVASLDGTVTLPEAADDDIVEL
jgi:trans-2,3-dihydro-3-hydroxyanthranilate isomerase